MKVVLQNVLDKDNKCFYYAFLGAARDYLKKCKFFKTNKKKINVNFLKQENLNFDRIKSNEIELTKFKIYLSSIFEFYRNYVIELQADNTIRKLSEYDVNFESKENIKNIINNTQWEHATKIEKIKNILLKTENLAIMFGLDYNICKLFFIDYAYLKNYNFIIDNENKINSILKKFIEIQINYNSFTTEIEKDFFTAYLNEKCSEIEIKIISFRKHGNLDFSKDNDYTKSYFYFYLKDFFKDILLNKNKEKIYVFLFTTDVHYRFLILNNKSIFTFQDISDLNKNLLDRSEAFEFTNIDSINSDYGKSIDFSPESEPNLIDFSPESEPNFPLAQQLPSSSPGAKTKKSSKKVQASPKKSDLPKDWAQLKDVSPEWNELVYDRSSGSDQYGVPQNWEKFKESTSKSPELATSKSPELATSRSPQRNMLIEDKHINLILNLPIKLTDLSKERPDYDRIITSSIENVNNMFSTYKKLNDLKIIRRKTNKIYKFNYRYPEKYLSKYKNEDLNKIISEIIKIIKIREIKDYLLQPIQASPKKSDLPKDWVQFKDVSPEWNELVYDRSSGSDQYGVPQNWEKIKGSTSKSPELATSKSPELATSRSPQRNMLIEDKHINLILNLPIKLTDLSKERPDYDRIITSSIENVNNMFSKYTELNNLKIIRRKTNKIYKFNYKNPEKYLSKITDFERMISDIISIIKIPNIIKYL